MSDSPLDIKPTTGTTDASQNPNLLGPVEAQQLETNRLTSNENPVTGAKLNADQYMNVLADTNPKLFKSNPALAYAMTTAYSDKLDPKDAASAMTISSWANTSPTSFSWYKKYEQAQQRREVPNPPPKPGFWQQAVTDTLGGIQRDIVDPLQSKLGNGNITVGDIPINAQDIGQFLDFFPEAVGGLMQIVTNQYKKGIDSGSVLGAINSVDPNTIAKNALVSAVSGSNNLFFLSKHYLAYLKSMANQYGWEATLSNQAPSFLLGLATGGAGDILTEGGAVAGEATAEEALAETPEAATIRDLNAKVESGIKLTPEEEDQLASAREKMLAQDSKFFERTAYGNAIKAAGDAGEQAAAQLKSGAISRATFENIIRKAIPVEQQAEFNSAVDSLFNEEAEAERAATQANKSTLQGSKKIIETVGRAFAKPTGLVLRGIGAINKALGGTEANAMYLYSAMAAQSDQSLQTLWDMTKNGNVVNADGTTEDFGLALAQQFGIGGMWGTTIKNLVDLDLNWVVRDPFGVALDYYKEAKSFHGFTGILGKWFGGTGIRGEGDVVRAYKQYSSVRRAINYIADHSSAQIQTVFRNTFSKQLAERLGEAESVHEVLSILEDVRGGLDIVGDRMPTMGWYSVAKTALRGDIAEEFPTVGDALQASPLSAALRRSIEEQTGVNLTEDDFAYARASVAEKAEVKLNEKIRAQFLKAPMSVEAGKITGREIENCSASGIAKITDYLKSVYMDDDFINAAGDALTRAGQDNDQWNRAFSNIMYLVIVRHMGAAMPYADFLPYLDAIKSTLEEHLNNLTGVDGGGANSDNAFVADMNVKSDQVIDDTRNINGEEQFVSAGIDDKDLGQRRLPTRRNTFQMARFFAETVQRTNRTGADDFIASTSSKIETVKQMAEESDLRIEDEIARFDADATADIAGITSEQYKARILELTDKYNKMLEGVELKGMSKAERYATVIKDLDAEVQKSTNALTNIRNEMAEIYRTSYEPTKTIRERFPNVDIYKTINDLEAEVSATKNFAAELKLPIVKTFASSDNIEKTADFVATMSDPADKLARENYKKAFLEKFSERYKRQALKNLGGGLIDKAGVFKFLGERGYRNNREIILDMLQGYTNVYFKRLALLSGAWSLHVSLSEGLINAARLGGGDFFRSKLASAIAKHEREFGLIAEGEKHARLFRDAVTAGILGIEKGLLEGLGEGGLERLTQNAVDLYAFNDGELPMGVHSEKDILDPQSQKMALSNKVVGMNGDEPEITNKIRDPKNYTKFMANDSFAGQALLDNMKKSYNGRLGREAARYIDDAIYSAGLPEFEKDEAKYTNEAYEKAKKDIEERGDKATPAAINAEAQRNIGTKIRELGAPKLSPSDIRPGLEAHLTDFIDNQDIEWRSRFARDTKRSAKYPDLSPHEGWAKTMADHMFGLGSSNEFLFPHIYDQMANGRFETAQETAEWLNKRIKDGLPVPNGFPAHKMGGFGDAMGMTSKLAWANEKIHSKFLGPIVNSLVREPIFLWEYHTEMEKLADKLESGLITKDEAMIHAQTQAAIHMSKYVHNPLDKTIWEENWRIAAPFYFAKNQAWRRAFRLLGEDPAAYEQYLKVNLSTTATVARGQSNNATSSFVFPGSQVITGITGGVLGAWLKLHGLSGNGLLTGFGVEGSASSPDSFIVTGSQGGVGGFIDNFLQIPFSNVVTIPAKWVYDRLQFNQPTVAKVIAGLLGPTEMEGSWQSDLAPSTTVNNLLHMSQGILFNDHASVYTSLEDYVLGSIGTRQWIQIRDQVIEKLIKNGTINSRTENNGTSQIIINYYAMQALSNKWNNTDEYHEMSMQANAATAFMYAIKTLGSAVSPVSISVNSTEQYQNQLNAIANEKGKNGQYLYPTYFQQVDRFMQLHPDEILDLVAHTSSTASSWPETVGMTKFTKQHYQLAREYPYLAPYLSDEIGKNGVYDPTAVALDYAINSRVRETPKEFFQNLQIALGNDYYYNVLTPIYQAKYPGTYGNGMSYEGIAALKTQATAYGQNSNTAWLSYHNGGSTENTAKNVYDQLETLVSDKSQLSQLSPTQQTMLTDIVQARQYWVQAYNQANGNSTEQSKLENDWYNAMYKASTLKKLDSFSGLFTVLRDLPKPESNAL